MSLKFGALGALLGLMATAAAAAPVTFDFTGGSGETGSAAYSAGPLGLTVTALTFDDSGGLLSGSDNLVTLREGGLGALHRVTSARMERNGYVDGRSKRGINDLLVFDFSAPVTLLAATFATRVGFADSAFTLFLPTVAGLAAAFGGQQFDVDGVEPFSFEASSFGIGALSDTDHFRVSSLTVDMIEIAPIPLPAAGGLLLGGLGLLALRRRRR